MDALPPIAGACLNGSTVAAPRMLSVLAFGQAFTLWQYSAQETLLEIVETRGFFNSCREILGEGNAIIVTGRNGAVILYVTQLEPHVVAERFRS